MTTKYSNYYPDEEEEAETTINTTKSKECILKEYLIVTEEEAQADTLFYLRHSRRLNKATTSDEQSEKDKEKLEQAFLALNFGKAKNVNDQQAEKLLKAYKLAEAVGDED